jgi:hypothetical protein
MTGLVCTRSTHAHAPSAAAAALAAAIAAPRPPRAAATAAIAVAALSAASRASQSRTVRSFEPDASQAPSGDHATQFTSAVWPMRRNAGRATPALLLMAPFDAKRHTRTFQTSTAGL